MIITVNGEMVENEAVIDYDGLVRNKSQILFKKMFSLKALSSVFT